MKAWLRIFLGVSLLGIVLSAARGQAISPSGISASPSSALPGDSVSFTVSVGNSDTAADFTGTATFSITLKNTVTGDTFAVTSGATSPDGGLVSKASINPQTGVTQAGTGSFTFTATIPPNKTEHGTYSAVAKITAITGGSGLNTSFGVSSTVLTVTGKPDLEVTGLTYPSGTAYTGGAVIPMTITYKNNPSTNGTQNVPYTPGVNGDAARVRIQIVLSSNPTFGDADDFQLTIIDIGSSNLGVNQLDADPAGTDTDNAGNASVKADGNAHQFTWNQILPGNFTGSYYVMAKIDSLNALPQNDPPALTVNGNNVWGGNSLNPAGTLINLIPSNFPTVYLASHGSGSTGSASGYSDNPSISTDGRYIAFASDATNLVTGDTNSARDIFIFDSQTDLVRRLSLSQQGSQGNGASNNPAISGNGRYVAFESVATNLDLVNGDSNGFSDIFVVDVITGLISRVSGLNASGAQANGPSFKPAMSSTGRYVVFQSAATNLVPGRTVTPGVSHVYLYDRDVSGSGTFDTVGNTATYLVDVDATTPAAATGIGNADAIQPTISTDGLMIAFASKANNLVTPAPTIGRQHVYLIPTANVVAKSGGTVQVSVVNGTGAEGNADSQTPSLSAQYSSGGHTGYYVAFASKASNLVTGDTNGVSDIFVYDTDLTKAGAPLVVRVSVSSSGGQGTDPSPTAPSDQRIGSINPTISADGRYVAFASLDDDLTAGDDFGQAQTTDSNQSIDVFVHDRDANNTDPNGVGNPANYDVVATNTTMVSLNPFGYQTGALLGVPSTPASNIYPAISANGRFIAFPSDAENTAGLAFGATNLLPTDSNSARDIFLYDRRTNASVTSPTAPSITITSPGTTNKLLVNTAIPITATATTTTGVVASVQFYVNGTSLGTSTTFPYTQTWTPTAVGTYTLSAIVTDSFGNIGVSANVFVTVVAAPSVGITSPAAGSSLAYTSGASTTLTAVAAASNPGAKVVSVSFYANGALIGTDTNSGVPIASGSFHVTWAPSSPGTYSVTAIATDDVGTTNTSAAVTIIWAASGSGGVGGSPPNVAITSPIGGAIVPINAATSITATAAATAAGATITSVQFYAKQGANAYVLVGSASASTSPYSVSWTPTQSGTYTLKATATDSAGTTTDSAEITVTVPSPPTVDFANGVFPAAVAPALPTVPVNIPLALTANTTTSAGTYITEVDYYVDGAFIGRSAQYPYLVQWPGSISVGTHVFTVVAIDNTGSKSTLGAPNNNQVTVAVGSGTAPSIEITSPLDGSSWKVASTIPITATATLGTGLASSVQILVNGIELLQSPNLLLTAQNNPTLSTTFIPAATGDYYIVGVVTDSAGNRAVSTQQVKITVTGPNVAPAVSITTPASMTTNVPIGVPITFTATATDSDGSVASVEFFDGGTSLGKVTTAGVGNSYAVQWVPTAGAHTLKVVATDNEGAQTSVLKTVTAGTVTAPTGSISVPSAIPVNVAQKITATATANSGTITQVEFFANGVSLGVASAFPYSVNWTPFALGTYQVTAVATDSFGNTGSIAPVSVQVYDPTMSPTVTITAPMANAVLTNSTTLKATAAPIAPATIAGVKFYASGVLIPGTAVFNAGTGTYDLSWTPAMAGAYTLTAIATDSASVPGTSAAVPVTFIVGAAPAVSFNLPANNASFQTGTVQTLSATATDSDGFIAKVQFFVDGTALTNPTVSGSIYSTTWTTTNGTHTLTVTATDDTGNVSSTSITVAAANGPQISVSNATVTPASLAPGKTATINVELTNSAYTDVVTTSSTGDKVHTPTSTPENQWNVGGTATFNVTFTNTTGSSFTVNNVVGTLTKAIAGLGGTGTMPLSIVVPTHTTRAGAYTMTVTLLSVTGSTAMAVSPFSFTTADTTLTVTGKPDLAITGLTYPAGSAYKGGDIIPMSLTYTNRSTNYDGTTNVPYVPGLNNDKRFFRIEIILSTNATFGDADDFLLTSFDIASVVSADDVNRPLAWNQLLPGNFAGTYYVMAKIDTLGGVSEVVESDLTDNGNNVWYGSTNAARITLLPTNFPTQYWASLNGNNYSDNPSVSGSGRYVVFASDSTNFVSSNSTGGSDTNNARDIFLYDQTSGLVRRISLTSTLGETNGNSYTPAISSDGRFVAFASDATNIVAGDTNGFTDIFVVDTITGAVTRDSVSSSGTQANGSNYKPAISADGRYVVWESTATNLVTSPVVTPGHSHIYRRDRTTGTTVLVSESTAGVVGNGDSLQATISGDGQYVAFASDATNLVANDTNGYRDIFLRDVTNGTTTPVSVGSGGVPANGASHSPSINRNTGVSVGIAADGRYIAYDSLATNLVVNDTNDVSDVFVYDRISGTTTRVSVSSSGAEGHDPSPIGPPDQRLGSINPSISATGRYVTFASLDDDLTTGDLGGEYSPTDANDALDVFVMDRDASNSGVYDTAGNIATTMASVNRFGYQTVELLGIPSTAASNVYPTISDDGRWVAFPSDAENTSGLVHGATNRTSPDNNSSRDVFLFDRRTNTTGVASAGVTVITAPLGNISLPLGSSTILESTTSGALGAILQVQYYEDGVALGAPLTQAPYALLYTPTGTAGTTVHRITAQAIDYSGTPLALSSPVAVAMVQAVLPLPAVSIDTPADQAKLPIPSYATDPTASIPIAVTVDTAGGQRITKVELYVDGVLLKDKTTGAVTGIATAVPYNFAWQPTVAGIYQFIALAYDDKNNVIAASPVNVRVSAPPTAVISYPSNNASVAGGAQTSATVTVSSSNGYPVRVQLFFDDKYQSDTLIASGGSIGTLPYMPVQRKTSDGTVLPSTLYVVATDPLGFTSRSTAITLNVTDGGSSTGGTVVGQPPTISIITPTTGTNYPIGVVVPLSAAANDPDGSISQVAFTANGQIVANLTKYPYNTDAWVPVSLGTYTITAKVTDNDGNTVTSTPVIVQISDAGASATHVALTAPANGTVLTAGAPVTLSANASDDVSINSVEFFINGQLAPNGKITASPYNLTWTPVSAGTYSIVARATDNVGNQVISSANTVTVIPNQPPSVTLTAPSSAVTLPNGTALALGANATDIDGTVTSVIFLANGIQIASAGSAPYTGTWLPSAAGTYNIIARATDNSGNVTDTAAVAVTVLPNVPPVVSITSPSNGTTVRVNSATTITASATDSDGSIANVQFSVNGSQVGSASGTPFTVAWTPAAEGVYRLTAVATDNAGATTTSATVFVVASSTSLDSVATGIYLDINSGASGNFTAINLHGRSATFIGYVPSTSTTMAAKTYYFGSAPVDTSGHFELDDSHGVAQIFGEFTTSGTDGYFLDGANKLSFTGPLTVAQSSSTVAVGAYSGSVTGDFSSVLSGIVTPDGHITLYVKTGTLADSGAASLSSTGAFTLMTRAGNKLAGTADPSTGLLTGTLTPAGGTASSNFTGAQASGTVFSDGTLRNISSRGYVGSSGDQVLIAGFVVNGSTSKHVLVRALGPALTPIGVSGALPDPTLQIFRLDTTAGKWVTVDTNDNWGTVGASISAAEQTVGASPTLVSGSLDAAVLETLIPGIYTVVVSGKASATGVALVEIYDVDSVAAYDTERMLNISTRSQVNTGDGILIGGFVVNGSTPKKVLVRGIGPGLISQGIAAAEALADPVLQVVRYDTVAKTWTVVRENDNWELGNDATLVSDAAAKVGAFPLTSGSKDAVILMNLPPGIYSAKLSGNNNTTGIGMIEVYEVQ